MLLLTLFERRAAVDKGILDRLKELDEETRAEEERMFGSASSAASSLSRSPRFQAINRLLHENPILVEPVLRFIQQKIAAIELAKLQILYTPEELEELRQRMESQGK